MAAAAVIAATLPAEPELRFFAHVAAKLLIDRVPRAQGSRAVVRRPGVGLQHLDHRDYSPGDEIRRIDWRQTARLRRPIVRRFESESASDWTLVLDASSSMAAHDAAKWQAAVHMAAALGYALLQLGHRVGTLVFGARVLAECPRGRGQHHFAAIARLLGGIRPAPAGERSELGVCGPHLHGAESVFVLGDFLAADEMRRDLGTLLQRCAALHAMQVGDAAETNLVEAGELDLEDVETGERMQSLVGAAANIDATTERAAMSNRLRSYCARSGIAFTAWDIAQPWQQTLLQHLVRARSQC
jgi:uncharacterized protein (DUF58 family)